MPVHQADELDGQLYIAMRYVPGTDLRAFMLAHGRLDPADAVRIVAQIAAALDAAHVQGLVHRDVKPANVLLSGAEGAEHAYLTDFGLTKLVGSTGALTRTGGVVGTLDYIAPEQLRGTAVDGRTDVYALGCVLYELLTGMVPFERDSDVAKLYAHISEPAPRPSDVLPDLGAEFDAVVLRALAKEPEERYATAGALAAAARAAVGGELAAHAANVVADARTEVRVPPVAPAAPPVTPPAATAPFAPPPPPARTPRRAGRRLGALVAVCSAGAIAAIIGFASGGPSTPRAGDAAHVRQIAAICEQTNRVQTERVGRLAAFERGLERARTLGAKRDHILEEIELRLSASTDLRTRLVAAPPAPAGKRAVQPATLRYWERNLRRLRAHRDALMNVRTYRGLVRVLQRPRRAAIEADSTRVITGLRQLGGSRCDLDPLVPNPVIRVAIPGMSSAARPLAAPQAERRRGSSEMPPVLAPPAVPPPAQSVPPEEQNETPEPPALPPAAGAGGGGGGGGVEPPALPPPQALAPPGDDEE